MSIVHLPPLHNPPALMEILLEPGAHHRCIDYEGNTALEYAAEGAGGLELLQAVEGEQRRTQPLGRYSAVVNSIVYRVRRVGPLTMSAVQRLRRV